jgi:hypothetical protein
MLTRLNPLLKRRLLVGVFIILAALFVIVPTARAESWLFGDILYSAISKVLFGVAYFLSLIVAFCVTVAAWGVNVMLELSRDVVNSPLVRFGYPVTLTFANLCFLIAVIVIAIMTILRQESYGMKQALWRLAVIALLVNFGLVISKTMLDTSDRVSLFFLNSVNPTEQGYGNFASALAGAFNPQRLPAGGASVEGQTLGMDTSTWGGFLAPITATIFSLFAGIGIVVSLFALVVMLGIRYIYLGYLMVVLPLAWASWIFPATKKHWQKWWDNFLKWTFFAPIVLFFLWLVIITGSEMSNAGTLNFARFQSGNALWAGVAQFGADLIGPAVQQLLQTAVLIFLLLAGLGAAHGMGIHFADSAQSFTKGAFKSVGGWAKRRGTQAGTGVLRTERGKKFAEQLQTGQGRGLSSVLGRIPGVRWGASYVGGGLEKLGEAGAEGQLKDAEKRLAGMSDDQLAHSMSRLTTFERIHALDRLNKNGHLSMVQEKYLHEYLAENDKNKALWGRYGKAKDFGKIRGESGFGLMEKVRKLKSANPEEKKNLQKAIQEDLKKAASAGHLAKTFFMSEKDMDDDKKRPFGMEKEELRDLQENILKEGVFKTWSGQNVGEFFKQITRGDQLEYVEKLSTDKKLAAEMSDRFDSWAETSGARALIDRDKLGAPKKLKIEKTTPPKPTFE